MYQDKRTDLEKRGAHGACETVAVKGVDGTAVRINAHDFDPDKHELFVSKAKAKDEKKPEASEAVDFEKLTKTELQKELTGRNVTYSGDATKADLVALAKQAAGAK